jgi:hypothetical protein
MSKSTSASDSFPSMRQKRFSIAAKQPELSMEAIASEVPSASTGLVEQVLDE